MSRKPEPKPNEREERLIAIAADAERRYAHVRNLLTSFLGNMPALSFIKDDRGRYLYASKSFAEFFEVEPEHFLGKTDHEWLPAEVANQFVLNDDHVRRTGKPVEVIERAPKGDEVIESIVQKFPVWMDADEKGVPFVGGIAVDITERLRSQKRISDLAGDLEDLAYIISHELQEPVNTIKSYQNLLAARYKDRMGEDADVFIAKCSEAATTIGRMVTDLWTLARVSKQKDFNMVDTSRTLTLALERLAPLIERKHARLTYGDLPPVHAVEKQIVDLFEQLIKNALQYSDRLPPEINVTAVPNGPFEEFCISDNGRGIDPMETQDMFKLYKRSGSQRPDESGAGMGLPICSRIVEHHGGTIRIESKPNHGTSVFFTLPRSRHKA